MAKKETTKKSTKKSESKPKVTVNELEAAVEQAAPIEEVTPLEVVNGDPAVVAPVEDAAPVVNDVPYSENPVTGELTPAEPLREKQEEPLDAEPAQEESQKPEEEIKPKKNVFKKMFGYIWNGQEMDY